VAGKQMSYLTEEEVRKIYRTVDDLQRQAEDLINRYSHAEEKIVRLQFEKNSLVKELEYEKERNKVSDKLINQIKRELQDLKGKFEKGEEIQFSDISNNPLMEWLSEHEQNDKNTQKSGG
jgi:hypothetical protein